MTLQPAAPQPSEDSASNPGSASSGDGFDDASSRPSEESASNQDSGNDNSDDDGAWVSADDAALLKAMSGDLDLMARRGMYPGYPHARRLPRGTQPVKLVGEGAANAVFEFKVPRRSGTGHDFKGMLLRVAKVPSLGDPPTYNYISQQGFYHAAIRPLLGEHAVHQELVILHKSGIVDELNAHLQGINHLRKPKFKGSFVGQSDWGFLVEDMRPQDPEEYALVEFKPKWLSQSPSAPKTAIRCRQCAMDFRNFVNSPSAARTMPEKKPCPLALTNPDGPRQVSSPFRMAPQLANREAHEHFEEALRNTANHAAIHNLKLQQDKHDRLGPLNASESDPCFALCMTLRDCTCFVQVPLREQYPGCDQPLKIRLGDLDWKDPRIKFNHWRGTEEELINGGFYTADWILCGRTYYHPPTLCFLEWPSTKRTGEPDIIHVLPKEASRVEASTYTESTKYPASHIYEHFVNTGTLAQLLQGFERRDTAGPSSYLLNPFRSDPR